MVQKLQRIGRRGGNFVQDALCLRRIALVEEGLRERNLVVDRLQVGDRAERTRRTCLALVLRGRSELSGERRIELLRRAFCAGNRARVLLILRGLPCAVCCCRLCSVASFCCKTVVSSDFAFVSHESPVLSFPWSSAVRALAMSANAAIAFESSEVVAVLANASAGTSVRKRASLFMGQDWRSMQRLAGSGRALA